MSSFSLSFTNRFNATILLLGKFFRFVFFIVFLLALFSKTQFLATYNVTQTLFFFLTFNLVDSVTQLFFREVYRFRQKIVSGDFDLVLVKPMSPLFRSLVGGADPLDMLMLIPYLFTMVIIMNRLGSVSISQIFLYALLLGNGFLIATGFHIIVLALAVVTTEIDHAVMIYRDLTSMGRVPVDIYHEPLRSLVTFVLPIGIMMTFPAKALLGVLSIFSMTSALLLGIVFFAVSLKAWKVAIQKYSSASS
jgi:ABC-2 type transport system permease protein